jgi:hypothetical protein
MRLLGLSAFAILLVAAVVSTAGATDPLKSGRVLFTKRADNICQKKGNDAERRIERGVRFLQHRHLRAAGIKFEAAYRELRLGYRRIARLHRPVQGHKHIAKWLRRERRATAVGVNSAVALQHRKLERAARLTSKAAHLDRLAYKPMRSFDFDHCAPL